MVQRVCLVSSGTGGHLLPAVALSDAMTRHGLDTLLLTEGRAVESALLRDRQLEVHSLQVGGNDVGLPWRLARAAVRARALLAQQKVDLLVSAGGRTALPAALAARSLGVSLCLLEQNAVPGRANRLLGGLARRIYYGLPCDAASGNAGKGIFTGTPTRASIGSVDRCTARRQLGLTENAMVVLVTGGSQGAATINRHAPVAIATAARRCGLSAGLVHVLHLAGARVSEQRILQETYSGLPAIAATVLGVITDMAAMYAAADLVICRGGGGTVAELMVAGRASVIVPYPFHRDRQQWHNAELLRRADAAKVVDEEQLATMLPSLLMGLLQDRTVLSNMGGKARALAPTRDPAERILDDMQQLGILRRDARCCEGLGDEGLGNDGRTSVMAGAGDDQPGSNR